MAQMIPDRLPRQSSQGEKRLFEVLQKLPDDYLVYYEPVVGNRYPDFVVVAPDLGVMIIEVKGWYPADIQGGDTQEVRVRDRGVETAARHPLRQARDYQHGLQDECRRTRSARDELLHAQGKHQGRFVFPFGHMAVLSNATADQLRRHPRGDLTPLFPPGKVITRDVLLSWEGRAAEEIRAEVRRFFDPFWPITPLTARQVDVLRAVIHPEVRIGRPDEDQLAVLDLRQERHARSLGDGHRILYGVAGSGKTVLLASRARLLAREDPEAEVLVLCFNVSLAAYLRLTLQDCPRVRVLHFDAWATANGATRQRVGGVLEDHQTLGLRLRDRLQAGTDDTRRFDAVLVDEAQDFDATWFCCVLEAMKDPADGDLLIVGDRNQGILGPRAVVWSQVGVQARGRTVTARYDLDRNYRNSREILELAACFATGAVGEDDEDHFGVVPVDPAKAVRSTGVEPVLLRARDPGEECRLVVDLVRRLLGRGQPRSFPRELTPGQVGILYPFLPASRQALFDNFLRDLGQAAPVVWVNDRDRSRGDPRTRVGEAAVKVQTIHSSKGLQYPAVVLLWADLLPRYGPGQDEGEDARLMYVGLTRPEDYLFVTCSRGSAFTDRMEASGKITTKPVG